ncbi:MAG: rRNA maturation RNase YbeY [Clostridia bacterium]|nr:rRNA maturation RNase YbeY [Clostridia bacterium]
MITISSSVKNFDINNKNKLEKILLRALNFLNQPTENIMINVYIVGKTKIKTLNRTTRNIDKVTDVLSYPLTDIKAGETLNFDKYRFDIDPSNNCLTIGEIVICNEVAISQAKKYGHSYTRELSFLFLHGVLHCLGYDHIEDGDRIEMESIQRKVLEICKVNR